MKVVIIGSGIAGISASLILAKKGHEVHLSESFPRLCPTLRGFSRQGNYYDTGIHITGGFGENALLTSMFRYLGLEVAPTPLDTHKYIRIFLAPTGRKVDIASNPDQFVQNLVAHFPHDEQCIRDFTTDVINTCNASLFLNMHGTSPQMPHSPLETVSLAAYLAARTSNEELKSVLAIHTLLHGVPPERVAFAQHARIAGSYFGGVWSLEKGGLGLVNTCEAALAKAGVCSHLGNGVAAITVGNNKTINSVILNSGEEIAADAVVYTAHPAQLPALFPPQALKPSFAERMQTLHDTMSASMLFCSAPEPIATLQHSTCFFLPELDITNAFTRAKKPHEGPFYITPNPHLQGRATSHSYMAIAPDGMEHYTAWRESQTHKRPAAYYQYKENMVEQFYNTLVRIAPAMAPLRVHDAATPLTLRDYVRSPNGGLYGVEHSLDQFSPTPHTRVPGLWIAGQSVRAPGLVGSMISAFVTCGLMTDFTTLIKEVRACR